MDTSKNIVAKVNNVAIVVLNGKERLVPIKPICEALGIDDKTQRDKINEDDILCSVGGLSPSTGADGKEYKMFCLPLEFVFGWILTINHKNVKAEAVENVRTSKILIYHALYKYLTEYLEFIEERQKAIDESLGKLELTKALFKNTRKTLEEETEELNKARQMNFNEWKATRNQLVLNFTENLN